MLLLCMEVIVYAFALIPKRNVNKILFLFLFRPTEHFRSEFYFILPMGPRGKFYFYFYFDLRVQTPPSRFRQPSNQKTVA